MQDNLDNNGASGVATSPACNRTATRRYGGGTLGEPNPSGTRGR